MQENNLLRPKTVNSNEYSISDTNSNNKYEIPGYDTVSYWVEQSDVPEIDLMAELPCKMNNAKEKYTPDGRKYIQGSINGISIYAYRNGASLSYSLPKFLRGNNIESIQLWEVKEIHNKMSELLDFSIYKAKVTRIDVAATFIMSQPFEKYLMQLGSLTRFNITPDTNGRYYHNSK
jgi:hypothetical protein